MRNLRDFGAILVAVTSRFYDFSLSKACPRYNDWMQTPDEFFWVANQTPRGNVGYMYGGRKSVGSLS